MIVESVRHTFVVTGSCQSADAERLPMLVFVAPMTNLYSRDLARAGAYSNFGFVEGFSHAGGGSSEPGKTGLSQADRVAPCNDEQR